MLVQEYRWGSGIQDKRNERIEGFKTSRMRLRLPPLPLALELDEPLVAMERARLGEEEEDESEAPVCFHLALVPSLSHPPSGSPKDSFLDFLFLGTLLLDSVYLPLRSPSSFATTNNINNRYETTKFLQGAVPSISDVQTEPDGNVPAGENAPSSSSSTFSVRPVPLSAPTLPNVSGDILDSVFSASTGSPAKPASAPPPDKVFLFVRLCIFSPWLLVILLFVF